MGVRTEKQNNLRRFRKNANLTQANVAEKLGVSQAIISRYESGERMIIDYGHVLKLSILYGVSVGEINEKYAGLENWHG